jgi:ankyrin repeat protein
MQDPIVLRKSVMRWWALLTLLALGGCATISKEIDQALSWETVTVNAVYTARLDARDRAAQWRERNPPSESQDYVALGSFAVRYGEKRCFPKEECGTKSHSETPTARLLAEAARLGGDVVVLSADNQPGSGTATKGGRCLQTGITQVPRHKCNYETECRGGFCTSRQTTCYTEYVSQEVCKQRETIYGTEHYVESRGTAYRKDRNFLVQARYGEDFAAALKSGNTARAKQLVDQGLRADILDLRGRHPLVLAVESGSAETAEFVLARGADPNVDSGRPMLLAVRQKNPRMLKAMLEKGGDPNAGRGFWQALKDSRPEDKEMVKGMLLREATAHNNIELARLLLEKGADPSAPNDEPIKNALGRRNLELIELLLKHGASASSGGVLTTAASTGDARLVRLLLDRGANVDSNALGQSTALGAAAGAGHVEVARVLISKGADVNKRGFGQTRTPLMEAVLAANVDMVRLLLEAKADVTETDSPRGLGLFTALMGAKSTTALGQARSYLGSSTDPKRRGNLQRIVELLQAAGAKE